jgi:predicted signal transduction protein with EAL and GGDEF domain
MCSMGHSWAMSPMPWAGKAWIRRVSNCAFRKEYMRPARRPSGALWPIEDVRFVVDEVGRRSTSIERLAKAPIWGLQLDRSCAAAVARDTTAYKVCSAVVGMARAMQLVPIATAIDSPMQRRCLLSIGCEQGSGDYYGDAHASDLAATGSKDAPTPG